jgi:hypothetical protein
MALATVAAAGCGAPWQVVRQADPNPLLGKTDFAVAPVGYEGLMVGQMTEADYLAKKEPQSQSSFQGDKEGMAQVFMDQLAATRGGLNIAGGTQAPPSGFFVRPTVNFIEPGSFNGFVNFPSEARMDVQLIDAQGALIDEIVVRTRVASDISAPSSGQRLRMAAERLGHLVSRYLRVRTGAP